MEAHKSKVSKYYSEVKISDIYTKEEFEDIRNFMKERNRKIRFSNV